MTSDSDSEPAQPTARLIVKVVPGERATAIVGWLGAALKVRLAAPPADGRANQALLSLLATALELPRGAVSIAGGARSGRKTVLVRGLSDAGVRARLTRPAPSDRAAYACPGERD